jgi:hypothetical protein
MIISLDGSSRFGAHGSLVSVCDSDPFTFSADVSCDVSDTHVSESQLVNSSRLSESEEGGGGGSPSSQVGDQENRKDKEPEEIKKILAGRMPR